MRSVKVHDQIRPSVYDEPDSERPTVCDDPESVSYPLSYPFPDLVDNVREDCEPEEGPIVDDEATDVERSMVRHESEPAVGEERPSVRDESESESKRPAESLSELEGLARSIAVEADIFMSQMALRRGKLCGLDIVSYVM